MCVFSRGWHAGCNTKDAQAEDGGRPPRPAPPRGAPMKTYLHATALAVCTAIFPLLASPASAQTAPLPCDGVVCAPAGPCRTAGVCEPATGACLYASRPDGLVCDDGNACTAGDTCGQGECKGGPTLSC